MEWRDPQFETDNTTNSIIQGVSPNAHFENVDKFVLLGGLLYGEKHNGHKCHLWKSLPLWCVGQLFV